MFGRFGGESQSLIGDSDKETVLEGRRWLSVGGVGNEREYPLNLAATFAPWRCLLV